MAGEPRMAIREAKRTPIPLVSGPRGDAAADVGRAGLVVTGCGSIEKETPASGVQNSTWYLTKGGGGLGILGNLGVGGVPGPNSV